MKRILTTTAMILAAGLLLSGPAAGQTGTSATADRGSASRGESVTITGSGWVPENRVSASICGNNALRGSSDCDLPGSRTIAATADGTFSVDLVVAEPPAPCPCVVFVTGEGTTTTVRFPINIVGVASAPTVSAEIQPGLAFDVLDARLEGRGPWTGYFGAATSRQLVLTVENVGSEARPPDVSATWGTGANPTHVVDVAPFDVVEPGAQAELTIPISIDAFTVGNVNVVGIVGGAGEQASFVTSTSHYPWALIITAIVVVQALLLLVRNRIRQRLHPEVEEAVVADADGQDESFEQFAGVYIPQRPEPAPYVAPVTSSPEEPVVETDEPEVDEETEIPVPVVASAEEIEQPEEIEEPAEIAGTTEIDESEETEALAIVAAEELHPTAATDDDATPHDPEVVLSASTRLATQLRHETDLAVADHHVRARELIDRLQDDVDTEVRALRATADEERGRLQGLASATSKKTDDLVRSAEEGGADLLRVAREHHDEALAVLTDARQAAQDLIDAAEARAAEIENTVSSLWTTTMEARATLDHRAQLVRSQADEVGEALRARLAGIQPSVDGQIEQMLRRADEQAAAIVARADEDESSLRTQAHERMVDIVRRTAEQLVVQVFTDVDHAMVDVGGDAPDVTDQVIDLVEEESAPQVVPTAAPSSDAQSGDDATH